MSAALLFAAALLTDSQASLLVSACTAHAEEGGRRQAIAVTDAGGHLVAYRRMEGVAFGIGEFAIEKAAASAAWRQKTSDMMAGAAQTPGFGDAPMVVTVPGGVPFFSGGGEFLGAIGVSGSAPANDESCALAAIEAAGLSATRQR